MSETTSATHQLDQLKQHTVIVADTGDIEAIRQFAPRDATTNPTLILKALDNESYREYLNRSVEEGKSQGNRGEELVDDIADRLLVRFGTEILGIIEGRVSTEVPAALSFDTEASVAKARRIIELYDSHGIARDRVLVKLASTWEGTRAAAALEKEGIHCNMTLLFSLPQAVACAEAGATLISPFVGRILDWYKASTGRDYTGADDPGVQSVTEIYNYYKKFGYPTEVMGASFRNIGEIQELVGCDLLTISPGLLEELANETAPLTRKLDPESAKASDIEKLAIDEKGFRWHLNEDAMATEKLAEGIRKFHTDGEKLKGLIREKMGA